jgi:hypothetical protein
VLNLGTEPQAWVVPDSISAGRVLATASGADLPASAESEVMIPGDEGIVFEISPAGAGSEDS